MTARTRSDVIITASIVVGVVGIVLALVGLILGGFGSSGDKAQVIEQPLDLPAPPQAVTKSDQGESASKRREPPSTAAGEQMSASQPPQAATEQAPDEIARAPSVAVAQPQAEMPADSETARQTNTTHPANSQQNVSEAPARPAEDVAPVANQEQRVQVQRSVSQNGSKRKSVTEKIPDNSVSSAKAASTVRPPKQQKTTRASLHSKSWLLQQDPSHYTIQIMAVRRLQALKKYAAAQSIPLELAYYRTRREGQDYFVLVAGVFPSREAARVAVSKLPKKVRANNPWIRKIEAVKRSAN